MKILVCITGGTIDSYYDSTQDTVVPYKESLLPLYFHSLKSYHEFETVTICMKDSREITPDDMQKMLDTITQSDAEYVLLTHGTYTMSDTGRFLASHLKDTKKTIVLTGAMLPLEFPKSDAGFNIGYSIAMMQQLDPGVYVCMNGKIFSPEEISKIISEGRFVSLYNK